MSTGFNKVTGSVTVDAETKTKVPIEYNAFVVEDNKYPDFATLADLFTKNGVVEDYTPLTDEEKKAGKSKPISLVELLIEGYKREMYTRAVGLAKERFNNSPAKVESSLAKELRALAENPDATPAQRERAASMLKMLSA